MTRAKRLLEDFEEDHFLTLNSTGFWGKAGAGCLIFSESTARYLVALRSGAVQEPGTWGTIGGAIDGNESPYTAVLREIKEECGYTGKILNVHEVYVFKKEGEHGQIFRYHNFVVHVPVEFEPIKNWETERFEWMTFTQLQNLSNKHFGLEALIRHM
jgi:8-oxo-dGTP pyrophosphatase MutT (NUDIX family)